MTDNKDTVLRGNDNTPTSLVKMKLKSQIKLYLKETGMTASQLAKKADVPKQSLSGWLAGSNPRDVRQVKRVADVLEITIDHLMFGDGLTSEHEKATDLEALLGDAWVSGLFEVKFRRVKK